MAKATSIISTNPSSPPPVAVIAVDDVVARRYTIRVNGHEVLVDPTNKGKPGDTVVLWPKKKCPVIVRRLARVCPYPGEAAGPAPMSDRYYFADIGSGAMFDVPISKTAAIHKVLGYLN